MIILTYLYIIQILDKIMLMTKSCKISIMVNGDY